MDLLSKISDSKSNFQPRENQKIYSAPGPGWNRVFGAVQISYLRSGGVVFVFASENAVNMKKAKSVQLMGAIWVAVA